MEAEQVAGRGIRQVELFLNGRIAVARTADLDHVPAGSRLHGSGVYVPVGKFCILWKTVVVAGVAALNRFLLGQPALRLAECRLVISDRYSDSRFAYQSVTLQGIVPDPEGWLRAMHNGWTIVPDKTFLCVLPVDDALTRLKPDSQREHFERRDVLEKVQNNYLAFARNEPSRFVIVDTMLPPETVARFVADAIRAEWAAGKKRRKLRKK